MANRTCGVRRLGRRQSRRRLSRSLGSVKVRLALQCYEFSSLRSDSAGFSNAWSLLILQFNSFLGKKSFVRL